MRDLTKNLSSDGTLRWEVPAGDWIILRTGMTPTGMKNSPASPEGQGLEVDKMNRALAQKHFDAFIGEVLRRIPAGERKAFKQVIADSYEMGSQNWTDGLDAQFVARYGYDPKPWLPVLTGRLVGGADLSERFLWDLRRLVADRVATDYVGGLRDAANAHGLGLWLENYGHWGFPGEFLKYGSQSDRIGGEFWVTGDLGSIECRAASSCANTYGKPFVSAESFTGRTALPERPQRAQGARRLVVLRRDQPRRAARLHRATLGGQETRRQCPVGDGVQPPQHLVRTAARPGSITSGAAAGSCSRAGASPTSPTSSARTPPK